MSRGLPERTIPAMAETPEISLVVPVYEEEENLTPLLDEIRRALAPLERAWEVILVDDGSRDGSWAVIGEEASRDAHVVGLRFERNRGQTAAFAAGFQAARGGIAVTLDADLQNDPADIPRLVALLEEGHADAVLGIRQKRNDSWIRRVSSRLANAWRRWRTHDDTVDTGCSLKVFQTRFVRGMPLFTGMHRFLPTLARLQGARVILQVPVAHRPRLHGRAKYGVWNRLWVGLADVRAVRWMQKRNLNYRVSEKVGGGADS